VFDKAAAYTNLVMIGGYAGAFTIWSSTKAHLTPRATVATALLLGASLTIFIFFEIYKMFVRVSYSRQITNLIVSAASPKIFLEQNSLIERGSYRTNLLFARVWRVCLTASLLTAVPAIMLLFYNFFTFLFGLPGWP
jgi:branched-subunit amino acid ABC-type transport system permease component